MAKASAGSDQTGATGRVKLPVVTLLVIVVLGVWLGLAAGGAAVLFLVRSGKLALVHAGEATVTGASRPMVLEPILVNLADEGGHAYLRVGLTLEMRSEAPATESSSDSGDKGKGTPQNAVRDIVLTVLGRQTSASLLGPDGKEHLKIELKEAVTKSNLKLTVTDLYFSDFLVQS